MAGVANIGENVSHSVDNRTAVWNLHRNSEDGTHEYWRAKAI